MRPDVWFPCNRDEPPLRRAPLTRSLTAFIRSAEGPEFRLRYYRDHLNTRLEEHLDPWHWHRLQDLRDIAKRIDAERTEEWRGRAEKYFNLTP